MQQFATPAAITAVLNVPAGRIQVIGAERADTVVEVRPAEPGKHRDVQAAEQVTVTYADGVLRIDAPTPKSQLFGGSGSVEVTVQVPAGSRVEAKAAACELRGVGRLGDVTFDGAYRQTKIDEASSLNLTAVEGDVTVGRLTGPAQITTTRGNIRITEAGTGTVVLHTDAGDITIGAAPGISATLDAGTGHGRITNTLKNDGTTGLDIKATTSAGNITAQSL
jgi:DUF4097 and DUF4098 domain-containing protein YvlB